MKKLAAYMSLSAILINARQKFTDLTDEHSFNARYLARRKQSPEHRQMMLDKAQAKRDRKLAKRMLNAHA